MKRLFHTLIMLVLLAIPSTAQVIIGHYSNAEVMQSMPEYLQAQEDLKKLRIQYASENKRAEDEFNAKYEEFLDSYSSLAPSIRRKRQVELQQMMQANVSFREESDRLLAQAEEEAFKPVQAKIDAALTTVATQRNLAVILNTDSNACPYINPAVSENITSKLLNILVP